MNITSVRKSALQTITPLPCRTNQVVSLAMKFAFVVVPGTHEGQRQIHQRWEEGELPMPLNEEGKSMPSPDVAPYLQEIEKDKRIKVALWLQKHEVSAFIRLTYRSMNSSARLQNKGLWDYSSASKS
eukprot:768515-Hanusia_phi.AAC.2